MNFVGIFSKNRVEWSIVDWASILFKVVTVPIYDTLGDENISYVLNHVSMKTVFVDSVALQSLKNTKNLHKLKWIVLFDPIDKESVEYFKKKDVKLISYNDLLARGKQNLVDYSLSKYDAKPEDCVTFSYTSGTTGSPKGAMISHKNFITYFAACIKNKDFNINENDVVLSYLPLPHIMERQFLYLVVYTGGLVVYYNGNILKLKDDILLVRPTIFAGVPRVYTRFYDAVQAKLKSVEGLAKCTL